MKNITTLLFSCLLSGLIYAQPSITAGTHTPSVGDSVTTYSVDTTTSFDPGNAGASQSWDFSSLNGGGNDNGASWEDPASTPYAGDFGSADLASTSGIIGYTFYGASSSLLEEQGTANQALTVVYNDNKKVMEYPFDYQDNFSDSYAGDFTVLVATTYRYGNIDVEADGYGSVLLNGVTYSNVLRVHTTDSYSDSLEILGFPIITQTINESWVFYEAAEQYPLISFNINTTISQAGAFTNKTINSRIELPVGIAESLTNVERFTVYPNPVIANAHVEIELLKPESISITLISAEGKQFRLADAQMASPGKVRIPLSKGTLPAGIYMVRLQTGQGSAYRKIVLL